MQSGLLTDNVLSGILTNDVLSGIVARNDIQFC